MNVCSSAYISYAKTTIACAVSVPAALLTALLALNLFPTIVGYFVAALCVLVGLVAIVFVCAGVLTIRRYIRGVHEKPDLFLELNRSRDAVAILTATYPRTTALRRWLARQFLGHDFVVGDEVEVKSWPEICATLDEQGCLEQMPFMPEMLAMCGKRARVFRCVHRLFDYRKTRKMRHMEGTVLLIGAVCNGSSHGGCEAACHTIWKSAWLRRPDGGLGTADIPKSAHRPEPITDTDALQFGIRPPRYGCQLTQLNSSSQPIGNWSITNFFRPLIAGNVTLAAFVVAWLTHHFDELQHLRQGVGFPAFDLASRDSASSKEMRLTVGDQVVVRSSAEIRATLDDQLMHKGMWLEPDMLNHCGHRHCVQAEIRKLIDIVTGEMRTMKTPAFLLQDVHFSGERQLFNAQYEPLFWRAAWLRREGD